MSAAGSNGHNSRPDWSAASVVARLRSIIDARDGGDLERAAGRCGVAPEALAQLGAALADDAREGSNGAAGVLAAAARAYDVDATWLVTGDENFHGDGLAPASRLRVADLLSHVGQRLLAARRRAVSSPAVTLYDSPHDDHHPPA